MYLFEFGPVLTFSQTSPVFYIFAVQVLKTLWEKEKLLVKSNFSFSHSIFLLFGELSAIFTKFKLKSANSFRKSLKFVIWVRVKLYHNLDQSWPFPKRQMLDSFKLKVFADDNFKLDENDRKFPKQVENTVGKGEIAR